MPTLSGDVSRILLFLKAVWYGRHGEILPEFLLTVKNLSFAPGGPYWEKAWSGSAASTNHCSTVFGSTSNTRATARRPHPSARAPTAHTSTSGVTRLPCNSVPCVSSASPPQLVQDSWRQGPPLG